MIALCEPTRCPNACITARHRPAWARASDDAKALLKEKRLSELQRTALTQDIRRIEGVLDGITTPMRYPIRRCGPRASDGTSDCLLAPRRVVNTEASCMVISSQLFEAYLECSTKCWLRSRAEPATENSYAEWARAQNETYSEYAVKRFFATVPEADRAIAPPTPKNPKDVTWRLAIDVRWRTRDLESRLHAVERIPSEGHRRRAQFIPYRFEFANKLTKEHKLLLAFDALLLSEAIGHEVTLGKIVHGDSHATLKVKTPAFASEVRKRIKEITALLAGNSPPELVLNRHCGLCEFKTRCSSQAREKDELSLLSGISEKDRKRLHSKGIFTVTQLSHTFRPRRRRRELRGKQEKHHHSLRALAIRENKIHAVGIPNPKLEGTPVFLDVEGLPDRDFYYLIGIRVHAAEGSVQHSFWADDAKEEKLIWSDFLGVLSKISNPHLIHYGSYETTFLKRMCKRHGHPPAGSEAAAALDHVTNLLSFIYAQVYFPTLLQWIEGDRQIPRFPMVGLGCFRARSDRMAASLAGVQGP